MVATAAHLWSCASEGHNSCARAVSTPARSPRFFFSTCACSTQSAAHSSPRSAHARALMADEPTELSALPPALMRRICALLPVDARARCATVSPGLRALLADCSLWTRLDLSEASGITCRVSDGVLRGAAARAGGALQTLILEHTRKCGITDAALLEVVKANAGALQELRMWPCLAYIGNLLNVLRAAPALRVLSLRVICGVDIAPDMLRNEPPYGPLRLETLEVLPPNLSDDPMTVASVMALIEALPAHAALRGLRIVNAPLEDDATCGALVDAALSLQLPELALVECATSAATASALARLLRGGALTELRLKECSGVLDEAASTAELAAALRESKTLTSLSLAQMGLWRPSVPGAALLDALTGHPSLQELQCDSEPADDPSAAGIALAALVAADAPALLTLNAASCRLGDVALGPLGDALPRNTHLRRLRISADGISEAFAAQQLLPAVRANASLR